jgi:hypothetical protein
VNLVSSQLNDVLQRYNALSKERLQDIFEKKEHDLAIKLYERTPKAKKSRITADVQKHKFAILANVRKGNGVWHGADKFGHTTEMNEAALALSKRKPGEKDDYAAADRVAALVTRLRINAIYWLSCGWLPAVYIFSKGQKTTKLKKVHKPRGSVRISKKGENHFIAELENNTPGIEVLQGRSNFVEKAIADSIADMEKYIKTKLGGGSGKTIGGYQK